MCVDSNSGVLSIKSILCQTWLFCFLCLFELGQSTEYNWFANLRFRGRTDKLKEIKEGERSATITEMRSRFGINIIGKTGSAKFVLQDSRFLGNPENNSGITNTSKSPFFHQVYFSFNDKKIPFFNGFDYVQLGRFELALGNQRIIAKNNWNNIGRSFDGFLFSDEVLSGELLIMHLFINETMNNSHSDAEDVVIDGLYLNQNIPKLGERSNYELYLLNFKNMQFDTVQDTTASYNNIGVRIDAQKNNFILETEYSFQTGMGGTQLSGSSKDLVYANMLSFNIGYKPDNLRFLKNIVLGIDQISGDDSTTYKGEGFSKEYGARHKHHGYYDYTSHKKYFGHHHQGLKETNLKANFNLPDWLIDDQKTNLLIALHNFNSVVGNIHYGSEIDFVLKTKYDNQISSETGAVFYFPSVGKNEFLTFFYLMITASF